MNISCLVGIQKISDEFGYSNFLSKLIAVTELKMKM